MDPNIRSTWKLPAISLMCVILAFWGGQDPYRNTRDYTMEMEEFVSRELFLIFVVAIGFGTGLAGFRTFQVLSFGFCVSFWLLLANSLLLLALISFRVSGGKVTILHLPF